METDPKRMGFWTGPFGAPSLPVEGTIETCLHRQRFEAYCAEHRIHDCGNTPVGFVAAKYDLGHQEWIPRRGPLSDIPHLVYATIDAKGEQRARVTAFPRLLDDMPQPPEIESPPRNVPSARPLPLE